jgi:regulatory ArsR family protein
MITGPMIAEIAALVGDPARATIVSARLDGRHLTASELAAAARITAQTASTHLAKVTEAGLLSREATELPPTLASSAGTRRGPHLLRPPGRPAERRLTDAFVARGYLVVDDEAAEIPAAGARFLTRFGIELPALRLARRHFCRLCLDWTERRPHIAGAVGAAITKRCFDLGWLERTKRSRAITVTALGRRGLRETLGLDASERGDYAT